MQQVTYLNADDVAEILCISKPYAYAIIQKWNDDLNEKGYLVIKGKIPRKYFKEHVYIDDANEGMSYGS